MPKAILFCFFIYMCVHLLFMYVKYVLKMGIDLIIRSYCANMSDGLLSLTTSSTTKRHHKPRPIILFRQYSPSQLSCQIGQEAKLHSHMCSHQHVSCVQTTQASESNVHTINTPITQSVPTRIKHSFDVLLLVWANESCNCETIKT